MGSRYQFEAALEQNRRVTNEYIAPIYLQHK